MPLTSPKIRKVGCKPAAAHDAIRMVTISGEQNCCFWKPVGLKQVFKRNHAQIGSHGRQDIERFDHRMPAREHFHDWCAKAERQAGLRCQNRPEKRARQEHGRKRECERPKPSPFVPVDPGEAIGDLVGIAKVSQHQFLDLAWSRPASRAAITKSSICERSSR